MTTKQHAALEAEYDVQIEVSGTGQEWTAKAAKDGTAIDEATGTSKAKALEALGNGLAAWRLNGDQTLAEVATDREPCLCGCLGMPKGKKARFLPGHDARYHAAQKREAAEAEAAS